MRRTYTAEIFEIIISAAIIALTIVVVFKSTTLSILFPVIFGLCFVLSVLFAFEGVLYNRNRVVKKSRMFLFLFIALIMAALSAVSLKIVL